MTASTSQLSIGQFAKLTHLSVKTLRHYHDALVLTPAVVDPDTGYRYYEHSQAHRAHLVRRLREADMSLADIAELLGGDDRRARVSAHVDQVARRARELAAAAEALQATLDERVGPLDIVRRELVAEPALVIEATTGLDAVDDVCAAAFERLDRVAATLGLAPSGPGVASFPDDVFESEGVVTCALPVAAPTDDATGALPSDIALGRSPAGVYLAATHPGDRRDVGVTYSVLGAHVDELGVGSARPVVERYLVTDGVPHDLRTEICWPVIS